MKIARVSDVELKYRWFGATSYITKDGRRVNSNAARVALKYQAAQSGLAFVRDQIDDLLGYKYANLDSHIKIVVPQDERNQNNPIWQKYEELQKLLKECTLLDRGKLCKILEICDELEIVLDPDIDIEQGQYVFVSKGKQQIKITS